jgi:hypothetical protein
MVLCSLHDPAPALAGMRRSHKPGAPAGSLEYVRSAKRSGRLLQMMLTPAWSAFNGSSCSLTRDSVRAIQTAGIEIKQIRLVALPGMWGVLSPGGQVYTPA